MASEENHNVFPEDDLDEDDDDSEEEEEDQDPLTLPHQQQQQLDDEDDDVLGEENDDVLEEDEDFNSASSADPTTVTVAVPPPVIPKIESGPDPKRHRVEEESPIAVVVVQEEKKVQQQQPLDESRRLFQRLWTDEDEIELLQGFLEYTTQRGSSQHHHHDTALFYDQIKSKLQLDFNKNQLVEKLRRLKKKYRNVVSRISSGKEFVFKSPHDQATFEISRKIWCDSGRAAGVGGGGGGGGVAVAEDGGLDDEEQTNANQNPPFNLNFTNNSMSNHNDGIDANSAEKKGQRSRKRSRVKIEEKRVLDDKVTAAAVSTPVSSIPGLIEDTVRSCLSPLFKELLNNAMNGPSNGAGRGFGGGMLSPLPLNFGGSSALGNFLGGEMVDEKWRKQQILELEVYSKRLDLVQDQIKATLEDLRSTRS